MAATAAPEPWPWRSPRVGLPYCRHGFTPGAGTLRRFDVRAASATRRRFAIGEISIFSEARPRRPPSLAPPPSGRCCWSAAPSAQAFRPCAPPCCLARLQPGGPATWISNGQPEGWWIATDTLGVTYAGRSGDVCGCQATVHRCRPLWSAQPHPSTFAAARARVGSGLAEGPCLFLIRGRSVTRVWKQVAAVRFFPSSLMSGMFSGSCPPGGFAWWW